ncbi:MULTISPECIES: LacI family DNA-binding transcriptional regulator [unclassified Leifsonia]|uniref:LacI family DNA-binding transcriptional regulator n=1 Tax=unclassified Leifsonia TaxID=2663824 RepID=UPI000375CF7D|nr:MULTISPECIES: LacI family DNA-binding transcriptional regulator [unclassified Leifsonia]TDQ02636.1 LacI family transcriptional regulator [Leifsonia sp. 115AMFTsu3.1]
MTEHQRASSMRDVAALAGVSHQTVSRVINGHPSIRESTRQRVLVAMDQLHYRPNRAARALVTARSRTIGILSTSAAALYGPVSSINAIQDAGRAAGYFIAVAQLADLEPESIAAGLDHLLAQSVEGLIVIAPQEVVLQQLETVRLDVPYVTLLGGPASVQRELTVDQVAGARAATRHLIDLGHRRIVHLSGPLEWFEAQARVHGCRSELAAAGLTPMPSPEGDWTAESGYRLGREVLGDPEVTAVFTSNDQMALGVYHAAHELGRRIPEDVSVVGFDDIAEAAHYWPPLTTVLQDFTQLGRRSVESLVTEIEGGTEPTPVTLRPDLVVRASTAPPVSVG